MNTLTIDSAVMPETVLGALHWRYAVKKFDGSRRIPSETWDALEEALTLTASSYGLQPWKFLVIEDPALRMTLKAASWNQPQIVDADRLVVFAARADLLPHDVERYLRRIAEVRGLPLESLDGLKAMMLQAIARPHEQLAEWNARQAYIALGNFLTSAALLGVDACPMEGIETDRYDEVLGLRERGYRTVVVAAAGYRSAHDPAAALAKVRFPREELVETL